MDAITGETSFVAAGRMPALSPDGRVVYLTRVDESAPSDGRDVVVERQLETGLERELVRRTRFEALRVSSDGKQLATVTTDPVTRASALLLIAVSGDSSRELFHAESGERLIGSTVFWSPDSASVFVQKSSSGGKPTFVRAWLDGRVTLHAGFNIGSNVQVHPNGRLVAYSVSMEQVTEVHRLDGLNAFD